VASGQLVTSASFLRIILVLEGEKAARKAAVKVLEMALERDDLSLIADLMRFLEPSRYLLDCPSLPSNFLLTIAQRRGSELTPMESTLVSILCA